MTPSFSSAPGRDCFVPAAALLDAARRGDTATVETLLQGGANPEARDDAGETPLHHAVRHGQTHTAACLLAHGASHAVLNHAGKAPLDMSYINLAALHAIRQRYHRYRLPVGQSQAGDSPEVAAWAEELERRGIIQLPGLIDPDALARMQYDFQGFVRSLDHKLAAGTGIYRHYDEEEHWWPNDRAYVSNNAFKYSAELVRFCCSGFLVQVANRYVGKRAFIQRGVAMRYLPSASTDNDMFGWHHDMEDRRLKLMILLTHVGPQDQRMSYVLGSHQLFHPLVMFVKNRCSLDYCRQHLGAIEIFDTVGQAGDVFLFDSNGAHRGNRRPDAPTRDAVFIEYTADPSDVWGGDLPAEVLAGLPRGDANPFERLLTAEKKWTRPITRKAPTWLDNLPRLESWL